MGGRSGKARAARGGARSAARGCALALLALSCAGAAPDGPRVLASVPDSPDPAARYLFYLHGRIIEIQGPEAVSPDFGPYEYHRILQELAGRGFTVVAQVRPDGAGAEFVQATSRQVRALLEAGVPADHVTVVGFSKGGFLALGVAAAVASDDVSYAILAGCGTDPGWVKDLGPRLRGRFLSLLDASDRFSPACSPLFAAAERVVEKDEHVFDTGLDHGLFYRPRGDWMDRLVQWANPTGAPGGGA